MSLLANIIRDPENEPAKRAAYLINIVRELGWDSLVDPRTIKPNLRRAQLYIRKHAEILNKIFKGFGEVNDFTTIDRNDVVDIMNPYLIPIWHVQIVGTIDAASLEFLLKK